MEFAKKCSSCKELKEFLLGISKKICNRKVYWESQSSAEFCVMNKQEAEKLVDICLFEIHLTGFCPLKIRVVEE